jgi:dTDP-4-dehydrorhamnose 3,5-epimerase
MNVIETPLNGILIFEPRVFSDSRNYFLESFNTEHLTQYGIEFKPVSESRSKTIQNVIRGLHLQINPPLVSIVEVIYGEIKNVLVDARVGSPTFGNSFSIVLSSENFRQIYIPSGFARGFAVLSDYAIISIKSNEYYSPLGEIGIAWNDPGIGIDWQIDDPILSLKDSSQPTLNELLGKGNLPIYNEKTYLNTSPIAKCFISYSTIDIEFAEKLRAKLISDNIACWFAPDDMNPGDRIRETLEMAIEFNEKVILVLSKDSIESDWVEIEVEKTFDKERKERETILIPIALDKTIFETNKSWACHIKRTRHVGDFINWKEQLAFELSYKKILRALEKNR